MSPRADRRAGKANALVIVGAGQAGAQAAFALRDHGFRGSITLVGDEPQLPYQRPPLSKKFLGGQLSVERLLLHPSHAYTEQSIHLQLHSRVEGVDRARQRVHLRNGPAIPYDTLLLTTGSRARKLEVPGARGRGVHYLRSLQDALRLRALVKPASRLAIVGGGYIGLEVAATARDLGASVVVFEAENRAMKRVTSAQVSEFFAQIHAAKGVEIRCDSVVEGFDVGESLEGIVASGSRWATDVAVIGIGALPNDELANDCGLACDGGIVVDEFCRTSDPNIFAAGDCTNQFSERHGIRVRFESIQNAVDQATCAALNIVGEATPYREVPWFWTQQYQYKLQSIGVCNECEEVEARGDASSGHFALLYYVGGQLRGCDAINLPREYLEARRKLSTKSDGHALGATNPVDRARQPVAERAECPR